ncbi:MAG: MarR family winged helix-turn-helix transcriptional regulator [Bacteroidota bacterium]
MTEGIALESIIKYWNVYQKEAQNTDLQLFASWLFQQLHPEKTAGMSYKEVHERNTAIGWRFGRLVNFVDLYAKEGFHDLPIRSFEDYAILSAIQERKNPSKMELKNLLVNEKSTVFEILKRLVREELITEHVDSNDRRVRRVCISPKGDAVLHTAHQRTGKIAQLMVGNLTNEEAQTFLHLLTKLDGFHTQFYDNGLYQEKLRD